MSTYEETLWMSHMDGEVEEDTETTPVEYVPPVMFTDAEGSDIPF